MTYLDFDLEIGESIGPDYPLAARSAEGEARGVLTLRLSELEIELALTKLQLALTRGREPQRRALSDEERAVMEFGRTLFECTFNSALGISL